MPILVDYRCPACGTRAEHWAPSPPPSALSVRLLRRREPPCSSRLSGLSRGTTSPAPAPSPAPARRGATLCSQYPQVPGLCHMSESAGRMWVAKYLQNGRAIDREQERQETAAAVQAPTMDDAISHHHTSPTGVPAPTSGTD